MRVIIVHAFCKFFCKLLMQPKKRVVTIDRASQGFERDFNFTALRMWRVIHKSSLMRCEGLPPGA